MLRTGRIPQPVAIINEALAANISPNTDPLGQQIRIPGGSMPWLTIVGVVGNLKHTQLMNEMSWVETPFCTALSPRSRVRLCRLRCAPLVTQARWAGDPEANRGRRMPSIPISDVEALTARLAKTLAYPRFRATVLAFFALARADPLGRWDFMESSRNWSRSAYPSSAFAGPSARRRDDLLLLVARQGGVPVLAGLSAGICFTIAFSRVLTNVLYGMQPADPNALALVSLMLLAVAALAILVPASRAARVDPMVALRDE